MCTNAHRSGARDTKTGGCACTCPRVEDAASKLRCSAAWYQAVWCSNPPHVNNFWIPAFPGSAHSTQTTSITLQGKPPLFPPLLHSRLAGVSTWQEVPVLHFAHVLPRPMATHPPHPCAASLPFPRLPPHSPPAAVSSCSSRCPCGRASRGPRGLGTGGEACCWRALPPRPSPHCLWS